MDKNITKIKAKHPNCINHQLPCWYCCSHCKQLGCADCLLYVHAEHMSSVSKIDTIFESFNKSYPLFMNKYTRNKELYKKLDIKNEDFETKISTIREEFEKQIQEYIQNVFSKQKIQNQFYQKLLRNPFKQLDKLKNFVKSNEQLDQESYTQLINDIEDLNDQITFMIKPQKIIPKIENIKLDKVYGLNEKHFKTFQSNLEYNLLFIQKKFVNQLKGEFENISIFYFKWDIKKSNLIQSIDDGNINYEINSNEHRYILSKEPLPDIPCYFEIYKELDKGNYDSLGACSKRENDVRNGENDDGWAFRLNEFYEDDDEDEDWDEDHGNNMKMRTGLMHDGKHKTFGEPGTTYEGKIGVLFNPIRKTLSYFKDGQFLGTAFTNVKGKLLYVCLEIDGGQKGDFKISNDVQLPSKEQYQTLV